MRHILFTLLFTFLFTQVVRSADSSTFWYGNRNNIEQLPTKSVGTDKIKAMDSVRGLSLAASDGTTMGFLDTTNLRVGFGTTSPLDFLSIKPGNNAGLTLYDSDDDNKLEISLDGIFNPQLALYDNDDNARVVLRGVGNSYITTGFFGLGASVPIAKLQINDENDNLTAGDPGNILIYTTDALAGDVGGSLNFGGRFNAGGAFTEWAGLAGRKSNATDGNVDGYLSFYTRKTGNFQQERMRIDEDGNVGIGTFDPDRPIHVEVTATNTAAKFGAASAGDMLGITPLSAGNGVIIGGLNDAENDYEPLNLRGEFLYFSTRDGANSVAERMRIDSSGKVGIGTSTPSAKLHATGDIVAQKATNPTVSANDNGTLGASDKSVYMRYDTTNDVGVLGSFQNGTGAKNLVLNQLGGNVGIGTSLPSSPLHVKAANNIIMSLQSSDATTGNLYFNFRNDNGDEKGWIGYGSSTTDDFGIFNNEARNLSLGTSGTSRLVIDSSGKVGIGTSNPQEKFEVDLGSVSTEEFIRITQADASGTNDFGIVFWSNTGTGERGRLVTSNSGDVKLNANAGTLALQTGSTDRLKIDFAGNVGIGTSSIYAAGNRNLEISGGGGNASGALVLTNEAPVGGSSLGVISFNNAGDNLAQILAVRDTTNSDAGRLRFMTQATGGSVTDRLVIEANGNVGIGTSSPSNPLEVREDGTATPKILVRSISNGDPTMSFLSDSKQFTMGIDDTSNAFAISEGSGLGSADRLVINSSGNVGIGDLTPGADLSIARDSNTGNTASYAGSSILLKNTDANYTKGDIIGVLGFGNDSAGFASDVRAGMLAKHSLTGSTAGNIGTTLVFRTSVEGSGTGQDRMTILDNGKVAVGASTTNYGIEAANGAVAGAGAYVDTSDERVKKNKQTLSSACSIITSLEAYYFDWKSAEDTADITGVTGGRDFAAINNIPEGYQDVGFMAQEVESIFPQAVTSNAYGLKGLQYSKIIPVMVQCLKDKEAELTAINLNFEARLQALEAAQ